MAKDKALKEWEKAFNGVLQEVAMEMQVRIETMYEIAIWDFYNEYIPISYIRTGATFYGSNKYSPSGPMGKSFFSNLAKRKDEYLAGILVSSDFITSNWGGNPYRADTDWVFKRTFVKGIHGNTSSERRKWGYLFKRNEHNWDMYNLEPHGAQAPLNWYKDYRFFRQKWKAASKYYTNNKDERMLAKSFFENPEYYRSSDLSPSQRMFLGNAPLPRRYLAAVTEVEYKRMVERASKDREGNDITVLKEETFKTYRRNPSPKYKMDKYTKPGNMRKEITKLMIPKLDKLFN